MSTTPAQDGTQWFLHTWRDHILEPIETALTVLDVEHTELAAEHDGLEDFSRRRAVDPARRPPPPRCAKSTVRIGPVGALRDAYADTVLAVDHDESVYDESLVENVAIEFGPDYAALFHPETNVGFSPPLNARWWPRLSKQSTNGSRWTALSKSNRNRCRSTTAVYRRSSRHSTAQSCLSGIARRSETTLQRCYRSAKTNSTQAFTGSRHTSSARICTKSSSGRIRC